MNDIVLLHCVNEDDEQKVFQSGIYNVSIPIENIGYSPGKFSMFVAVLDKSTNDILYRNEGTLSFLVNGENVIKAGILHKVLVRSTKEGEV